MVKLLAILASFAMVVVAVGACDSERMEALERRVPAGAAFASASCDKDMHPFGVECRRHGESDACDLFDEDPPGSGYSCEYGVIYTFEVESVTVECV